RQARRQALGNPQPGSRVREPDKSSTWFIATDCFRGTMSDDGRAGARLSGIICTIRSERRMTAMTTTPTDLDQLSVNAIRALAMDAVQAANSGHPGTPMAMAPV